MWVLIIALFVFVLIRILLANNIISFRKNKKIDSESLNDEALLERTDLNTLIADAEKSENFRLATRYRFMKILQELEKRNLIQPDSKKTNWDYMRQMSNHPLLEKFRYLTTAYEYVWYGEFNINRSQYDFLKAKFEQFI